MFPSKLVHEHQQVEFYDDPPSFAAEDDEVDSWEEHDANF